MKKHFKAIMLLIILSSIFANYSFAQQRPTGAEVEELRVMIEKAKQLFRTRGNQSDARTMMLLVSFNARFRLTKQSLARNDFGKALSLYNSLYPEVKSFIERYEPPAPVVIQPPSREELRELNRQIDDARRMAREKNANNFFARIDQVEDQSARIKRKIRRNDNQAARSLYDQAIAAIRTIMDQLNQFQPPRRRIKPAADATDSPQQMNSFTMSYVKNFNNNRIHGYERADYRYELSYPAAPNMVNLKIWGRTSSMGREYTIRVRVNGHKVIQSPPSFSASRSVWNVSIPASHIKNGANVIRIVLIRPKSERSYIDIYKMILELSYNQ